VIRNHNPLHKSYYEQFADGTVKCIDEEIPFEIPESWEWCRGYTCFLPMVNTKPVSEFFRYIDIESVDNKKHCITSPKVIQSNKAPSRASRKLSSGDTLFSLVRPYLENIAFIDDSHADCIASTGFYVCKPNQFLNPKYCFRLMTSLYVIIGLNQYMKGDNSPSINNDNILSFLYPIPPYAEQQRIVFTIEQYNNLINELEENKEDLKQFVTQTKSKILDLAIRGKLVPQNPNDEPASVLLERIKKEHPESKKRTKKTSDNSHYENLPFEVPENWAWCRLADICSIITDGTHQTPTYSDEGYIFLSSKNVTSGKIDWENVMYIPEFLHNQLYARLAPQKGDILLAKNGTTGFSAVVDRDCVFDIYVSLALLRPFENKISPYYLRHIMSSLFVQEQFRTNLKGIGVPNLHLENIRNTYVPICSLKEQNKIVSTIDQLFEILDNIIAEL